MNDDLAFAERDQLTELFATQLANIGPAQTLPWLVGVLESQSATLRSSNAGLVAYTGRPEAIEWLETNVASPVTPIWGSAAALLGSSWPRIVGWLRSGDARMLMGLDALVAYRAPAQNMSALAQIAAPVLPEAPTLTELETTLGDTVRERSSARVRKTSQQILTHSGEIMDRRERGVAVADLPRLFLRPETFPGAAPILARHGAITGRLRHSVQELVGKYGLK